MSGGQQAAAIGTTTAIGAGIGAAAGGGIGAAIGATAGLAASGIGVMLTRGRPTEVYPETMITFRLDAPVAISTAQGAGRVPLCRSGRLRHNRPATPDGAARSAAGRSSGWCLRWTVSSLSVLLAYYYGPGYAPGFSVYLGPGYGTAAAIIADSVAEVLRSGLKWRRKTATRAFASWPFPFRIEESFLHRQVVHHRRYMFRRAA